MKTNYLILGLCLLLPGQFIAMDQSRDRHTVEAMAAAAAATSSRPTEQQRQRLIELLERQRTHVRESRQRLADESRGAAAAAAAYWEQSEREQHQRFADETREAEADFERQWHAEQQAANDLLRIQDLDDLDLATMATTNRLENLESPMAGNPRIQAARSQYFSGIIFIERHSRHPADDFIRFFNVHHLSAMIFPDESNGFQHNVDNFQDINSIPPVAIAGQNDEEILNKIIPELSGSAEEKRVFMKHIKEKLGIHEKQSPKRNEETVGTETMCSICTCKFSELGVNSVWVTNCCGNLICQNDVEEIEQRAFNFFTRSKDGAFRRVYSQRNGPRKWEEVKPLGVCPFCRHYPLLAFPKTF